MLNIQYVVSCDKMFAKTWFFKSIIIFYR